MPSLPLGGVIPPLPHTLVTNEQRVASLVHVEVRRNPVDLVVDPETVHVYYLHSGSRGDEMRPHRIAWIVSGLAEDESLEIFLHCARVRAQGRDLEEDDARDVLARMFPRAMPMKAPRPGAGIGMGWTVPFDAFPSIVTGEIRLPDDDRDRINVKYSLRLMSGSTELKFVDPGGNLIPDP